MEDKNTEVQNNNEQKIVEEIINDMVEDYNISKNYSTGSVTEDVDQDLPPSYDPTAPNNTNQHNTDGLHNTQVDINSANRSGSGLLVPQNRPLPRVKLFRIIGSYRKGVLQFVVEELRRLGFRLAHPSVPFEQIHVFWSRSFAPHLTSLRGHQKVNFLPAMAEVCRKDFLNRNIRKARAKYPDHAEVYNFWPIGFNLPHEIEDMKAFVDEQTQKGNHDMTGPFILKPPLAARGEGIRLVANVDEVDLNDPWYAEKIPLAQLYVKDPLLIEGFKITFRIYAALTSLDPTVVYVYPGGLGRICSEKYKLELDSLKNLEIHLTNYDLNVHNEQNFNDLVGNSIQHDGLRVYVSYITPTPGYVQCLMDPNSDLEYFFEYMKERNRITDQQIEYVWQQIKSLVGKTFISSESIISLWVQRKVPKRSNGFELTGFDILIDSSFKVWLLEVNHTPSLSPHTELENKLKRMMIRDLLQLVDIENKDQRQITQEADRKYAYVCKLNEESPAAESDPLINADGTVNIKKLTRMDIVTIVSAEIQDHRKGLWQRAFPIAESLDYVSVVENRRSRLLVHWFANNMDSNQCLLPLEERPVISQDEQE